MACDDAACTLSSGGGDAAVGVSFPSLQRAAIHAHCSCGVDFVAFHGENVARVKARDGVEVLACLDRVVEF